MAIIFQRSKTISFVIVAMPICCDASAAAAEKIFTGVVLSAETLEQVQAQR